MRGDDKTNNITDINCLNTIMESVNSNDTAIIYRNYNSYLFLIGYEVTPHRPPDAYRKLEDINK